MMPPLPSIPSPLFHLPRRRLLVLLRNQNHNLHTSAVRALCPSQSTTQSTTTTIANPDDNEFKPNPNPTAPTSAFSSSSTKRTKDEGKDEDDFYALLLSNPLPRATVSSTTHHSTTLTTTTSPPSPNPSDPPDPKNQNTQQPLITFSTPLAGPSARMRGLARAETGLDRPPEPDNCCMSGCVNCVWEAYREEVEEWARARRAMMKGNEGEVDEDEMNDGDRRGSRVDDNGDGEDEEALFEEVDVGMREFMRLEKKVKERKRRREMEHVEDGVME